jgi:hypothetical protein|tara:strand:+ start:75 stop:497 length:423 start_codon:yes stop_codon:yes gene_type:complete
MATNASRDTTTGTNYETEVENLLEEFSDHKVESQVMVGAKRNGGKHYCDIVINDDELISLKYQRVQGTAEEKIPFEFMKLQHAIDDHGYKSATIVVAGPDKAWKWKDYYLSDDFRAKMMSIYPDVRIINHDQFVQEYLYQ